MSPLISKIPVEVHKIFRDFLNLHVVFCKKHPETGIKHEELSEANVRLVLPVYTTAKIRLKSKRQAAQKEVSLAKLKRVAWRFFFDSERGVRTAAELHIGRGRKLYNQLQYGDFVWHTYKVAEQLPRKKRLRGRVYSLALLQLPALYFSALWLRDRRKADLFVALVSVKGRLRSGYVYKGSEIERALSQELIRARKAKEELRARKSRSGAAAHLLV